MINETLVTHKVVASATIPLFHFQMASLAGQSHERPLWRMEKSGSVKNVDIHAENDQYRREDKGTESKSLKIQEISSRIVVEDWGAREDAMLTKFKVIKNLGRYG
jgi:hypothetical protein